MICKYNFFFTQNACDVTSLVIAIIVFNHLTCTMYNMYIRRHVFFWGGAGGGISYAFHGTSSFLPCTNVFIHLKI